MCKYSTYMKKMQKSRQFWLFVIPVYQFQEECLTHSHSKNGCVTYIVDIVIINKIQERKI